MAGCCMPALRGSQPSSAHHLVVSSLCKAPQRDLDHSGAAAAACSSMEICAVMVRVLVIVPLNAHYLALGLAWARDKGQGAV
jgi:hypothetical protein